MKNKDFLFLLSELVVPVALMAAGIVLIFVPDTGSILLSRVLGFASSLGGVALAFGCFFSRSRDDRVKKLVGTLICLSLGSFLLSRPLALVAVLGRILGALLALRGIRDLFRSASNSGRILSGALAAAGIVLILLPLSASRLLFSGCGVVLVICGAGQLIQRLKEHKYLPENRDDIIDAL